MNNTSYISVEVSKNTENIRTSPVYVQEKGRLSLNDIMAEKPADFNGQIDISWLTDALNQKACEIKYAPWDALYMPQGLWVSSAYGSNTIIAVSADGKICLSHDYGTNWEEKQINDNLTAASYGNGVFILLSNTGKCFKSTDKGISWEESIIDEDNFSCITYNNNKFIAGTSSGRIYVSEDYGQNWQKVCEYNNMQISKITYSSSNIIMAVAVSGSPLSIYSIDDGSSWNEIEMPSSSWISLTYGKDRFMACAYDGDIRLAYCLEKDIISSNPVWKNTALSYNEPWKDICYGANVYTLASSTGVTLASSDGIRWIKTPCPYGAWNNILRTDYFFMTFSADNEANHLNAIRSSNGGLAGIMFATLNEIIHDENVDKAVNPQTLKDYLAYRTGKNTSQYPVYSDDLLIECTSLDTRQIKITNIDSKSTINDYNDIKTPGIYIIEKTLNNGPDLQTGYMLVQAENNKIHQFLSPDYLFTSGYMRQFSNNLWSSWQKKMIKQENIESLDLSNNNITVSSNSSYSDITNIIAEENGSIKKISKNEVDEEINNKVKDAFNLMAGNNVYWNKTADYKLGAAVLGSDNALYYCIKANGSASPQNPVSASSYWLKIINSNGKINADNLSVSLGTLALLNNIALTNNAITGILPISKGGTGRTNGMSNGIADNTIITENNWQTAEQRGLGVLYWQTTDIASKKLPYTAGAMIRNYFVSNLKSALAFDLGNAYVSIFDFKQNRWKQIAFNDDVVNKMPKVSKNNGIGHLQQIAGQGVPVTYRLPSDGTYFYFLTCTNDYNNYNAVDNKAGIAEGGSEIISASMNKKTFGGFIWRIQ